MGNCTEGGKKSGKSVRETEMEKIMEGEYGKRVWGGKCRTIGQGNGYIYIRKKMGNKILEKNKKGKGEAKERGEGKREKKYGVTDRETVRKRELKRTQELAWR